jgi:peptidyl-prolyl cis-trans isomerase SurA
VRGAPRLVVLAAAVAFALSGCSVPSWMPLVGKAKAPPPPPASPAPPPPTEFRAPILSRPAPPADSEAVVDRVICVVNSDAVTLYELEEAEAYAVYESKLPAHTGEERAALRDKVLAGIIEKRLQLQLAEREKITVDDAEMKEQLDEIQKRLGAKNEVEFDQMVKAQGLTLEGVKKRVREQLLVERIKRRKVSLRISVTEEDIDQYLNANREKLETGLTFEARHILFLPTAGAGEDGWQRSKRRAEDVYTRVMGGDDFGELAREFSDDTATSKNGGQLGILKRGELAPDIEKAILRLSPGEHSPPFRSEVGYHLFELESKETLAGEQLTQARNQIRDILYKQKYDVRLNEWLVEIRGKAIIEMRL